MKPAENTFRFARNVKTVSLQILSPHTHTSHIGSYSLTNGAAT